MKQSATVPVFNTHKEETLTQKVPKSASMDTMRWVSPLFDLAPLALPGISQRVTHKNKVSMDIGDLYAPFLKRNDSVESTHTLDVRDGFTEGLLKAAFVAVLPAAQFGFNIASMNTGSRAMRADLGIPVSGASANDTIWGFCIAVFCMAAPFGTQGAARVDFLGRRRAIFANSALYVCGALLQASSSFPECVTDCGLSFGVVLMSAGRAVSGFASGATTVLVPMYLGEIAPAHLRGAFGTAFQLVCVAAMMLAQVAGLPGVMGNSDWWPRYMLLPVVPALIMLVFRGRLLESPRWLARSGVVGNAAQAREVLAVLRAENIDDNPRLDKEVEMLTAGSGNSANSQGWSAPGVRMAVLVSCVCSIAQQFSGINNAFNYSSSFLEANGLDGPIITEIAVSMNVANVCVTLLVTRLMDSAGRKMLLLLSAGGMWVSIIALTVALASPGHPWTSALSIVSVVFFVMTFGIGMGPVPWLLPAELFPMDMCSRGTSLAATCNWIANFIVVQSFPIVSPMFGPFCFLPFACVLTLFIAFVWRFVPETRGKALHEIITELSKRR